MIVSNWSSEAINLFKTSAYLNCDNSEEKGSKNDIGTAKNFIVGSVIVSDWPINLFKTKAYLESDNTEENESKNDIGTAKNFKGGSIIVSDWPINILLNKSLPRAW